MRKAATSPQTLQQAFSRAPKTFVAAVHSVMGIVCGECKRALVQVQPECCPDEIRVALCNAKLEWLHFASHTM